MQEMINAIGRVTDIMAEISAASREQSSGVSQVGEAITQMDRTTQQNAALVEESAAAADNLHSQSRAAGASHGLFPSERGRHRTPQPCRCPRCAQAICKTCSTPRNQQGQSREKACK